MTFREFFVFLAAFIFSLNIQAENIQLIPNYPQQYTVVKGDTLWGISEKFLANPWQWYKVWQNNSQIENPYLIVPGDTVYLSYVNGQPQLSLGSNASSNGVFDMSDKSDRRVNLDNNPIIEPFRPRIRESKLTEAIKSIPISVIAPFMSSPKIVSATELSEAPYVISVVGEHIIAGAGDLIYVRAIEHPENLGYTVFRSGETYVSPVTEEVLGYQARYIANATIQTTGDPAKLLITHSNSEIRSGDRLLPNPEHEVTLHFFPRTPEDDIKGSIISILDGVDQISQFQVVVIDQGIRDGIEVGHVLEVLQRSRVISDPYGRLTNGAVQLPDESAGLLMVFRTFEKLSYAIVMEASKVMRIFDKVQSP